MSKHIYTHINPVSERDMQRVKRVLDSNGIIAFPTDTNWAFGCDAASPKALEKIRRLKPSHPKDQPFSLMCADIAMASEVANIDNQVYRILKRALPGPYTVLLVRNRNLPRQIRDKRKQVGVRVPSSPLVTGIIKEFGRSIAATSVPDLKDGPARFGYQVFEVFGHAIDLVLDLGEEVEGQESTIVDLTEGTPVLIRQGSGSFEPFEPN